MTIAVDMGRKATKTKQNLGLHCLLRPIWQAFSMKKLEYLPYYIFESFQVHIGEFSITQFGEFSNKH